MPDDAGTRHEVGLAEGRQRVTVTFNGVVVGETERPLVVRETGHSPVYYLPRADVKAACLLASDHSTYCPYKGTAGYFHLRVGERIAENAAWHYPDPIAGVEGLRGHLAFYPARVDRIAVEPDGA
jgi:uncharacterized protein (DUF427 family)